MELEIMAVVIRDRGGKPLKVIPINDISDYIEVEYPSRYIDIKEVADLFGKMYKEKGKYIIENGEIFNLLNFISNGFFVLKQRTNSLYSFNNFKVKIEKLKAKIE